MSEFLLSWGQIMRALALPSGSHAKILEYGSGSGQLLLFLARLGLQTFTVDIDAASLGLVQAQAAAMKLDVRTEQAAFEMASMEQHSTASYFSKRPIMPSTSMHCSGASGAD